MGGRAVRLDWFIALTIVLTAAFADPAHAQGAWGIPWRTSPSVLVLSPPGDSRYALVAASVQHWNDTFASLGVSFRVGPVSRYDGEMPKLSLPNLSTKVVGGGGRSELPAEVRALPGNIVVILSDDNFVSFAARWPADGKALVAIRTSRNPPLSMPNVAINVITHELGHALGLGHNGDVSKLMCGRPAPCRPPAFASATKRIFPLTDDEREKLRAMYGR